MEKDMETRLEAFARALVDQEAARIIVPPKKSESGYWFGGGKMVEDSNGTLYLSGRYRNYGDSREGLARGERGLELAIFRSEDRGRSFEKILSFSKADLSKFAEVYSIEGTALHLLDDGSVELFISTEKKRPYPPPVEEYLKPGTGVWSIDRIPAASVEELKAADLESVLKSEDPVNLHIKDPFVHDDDDGNTILGFCSHPFSWSSTNTGYAVRPAGLGEFGAMYHNVIPKGQTWDVSMARATSFLPVRNIGVFTGDVEATLVFYDSAECLRNHQEHAHARSRPRGYSCEELGGCGYFVDEDLRTFRRLSRLFPMFVSPEGTGSSRYVSVLETRDGYYANWQQSRADLSQPTVLNFLSRDRAEELLA